jgi:hypothetical protein
MSYDDLSLDTSWINKQDKLANIQNNYFREPIENINAFFIYINQNDYISQILCEKIFFNNSIIQNIDLIQIIQQKKIKTPTSKYKLYDIFSFIVDIEPQHIQSYVQSNNTSSFLKSIPITNDIVIPQSIFIFHDVNALYFFFKEIPTVITSHRNTIKSILKNNNNDNKIKKKSTKKVSIHTENTHSHTKHRNKNKTRKKLHIHL